jgi:hypothetical protein
MGEQRMIIQLTGSARNCGKVSVFLEKRYYSDTKTPETLYWRGLLGYIYNSSLSKETR